jgi:hypothetical protein
MAQEKRPLQETEKEQRKFTFSIKSDLGDDGQLIDGGKLDGNFHGSTNNLADALTVVGESNEIIKNGIIFAAFTLMEGNVAPHLERYLERQFNTLSSIKKSTN